MNRIPSCRAIWIFILAFAPCAAQTAVAQSGVAADCGKAVAAFSAASADARVSAAQAILQQKCPSAPPAIFSALREAKWSDGAPLAHAERLSLLLAATRARFAEGETLSVSLLESGTWPTGGPLILADGVQVVTALGHALTPFRVRLLLDVYEQRNEDAVREAVILALRGSELPEALLPALDASYGSSVALQHAAQSVFPTLEARDAALAKLRQEFSSGPAHDWLERLAAAHPPVKK